MSHENVYSTINYYRLTVCFCVTGILSLSVHAVMLQVFHVSYPSEQINVLLPKAINNILMMGGIIWLEKCLSKKFFNRSVILRVSILFLLLLCLNETFRGWFMNAYCSNPSPKNWLYFAIALLPQIIFFAIATLLATVGNYYFHNRWIRWVIVLIFGLFLSLVMPHLTNWFDRTIMSHLTNFYPTGGWCQLPYGMKVLIPAYLTFIEPVLAVLVCIGLVRQYLAMQTLVSSLEFMLLILTLKKQLLMALLYAIYAHQPFFEAFISMGQFMLEAMVLSFFLALSWDYASA